LSKAFTKEDSGVPEAEPLPARPPGPHPITPRGLRELREELAVLAPGSHRARVLSRALADVVEQPPASGEQIGFGSVVELELEDDGRVVYELVGIDETRPEAGRISFASPIGRALIGHRLGDEVTLRRPRGDVSAVIARLR
jgi:hypothetical protein